MRYCRCLNRRIASALDREIALGRFNRRQIERLPGIENYLFCRRVSDENIFVCLDVQLSFYGRLIKFRVRLAVDIRTARREFLNVEIALAVQIGRAGHIEVLRLQRRAGISFQIFCRRNGSQRHRVSARHRDATFGRLNRRDVKRSTCLQCEIAGSRRIRHLHRALAFHLALAASRRKSCDGEIRIRRHLDRTGFRRRRQVFSCRSVSSCIRHVVPRDKGAAGNRRLAAIVGDGNAAAGCAHFTALDGAGIRHRQVSGQRRKVRSVNRAFICERETGCFRRGLFVSARERTALDDRIRRIVNGERIRPGERPVRDSSAICERQILRGNGRFVRRRIAEECDVRIAFRFRRNLARRDGAVLRLRPRYFHADGICIGRIRVRVLPLDILRAADCDVFAFDIDIRRAGLRAFGFIVISFYGQKASFPVQIQGNIALRGVNRIDNEIAVFLGEGNAVFGARREDTAAGDIHVANRAAAGLEHHLSIRARRDTRQIAGGLQADFVSAEESAPFREAADPDEIDRAFIRKGRHDARRFRINRTDGGNGDDIPFHLEIAALGRRQRQELRRREFRRIGNINGHPRFLFADVAAVIRAVFPKRRHRDRRTGDMRRFLEGRIGIRDAFLDAARRKGNQKRFRGRRRSHETRRFFILCEEGIARKRIRRKRRIPVERRIRRIFDGFHIRLDAILRPLVDTGRHELLIALLPFRHVRRDLRLAHSAVFESFRRRRIQHIFPILNKGAHTDKFAVFSVNFRLEQILLLLDCRAFPFENRFIRPVKKLFLRAFIRIIREIVIEETAVRLERDGALFGNDAVDVEIAGRIFDVDIPVRARFETVIGPFVLPGGNFERSSLPFGIRPANHAAGNELDTVCRHRGARLLDQITVFSLQDGRLTGRNIADIDGAAQHIDAEVLPRRPGNIRRIRPNERPLRARIFRGRKC